MAFNETEVFPLCEKFGYTSTPNFSVEIVETAGDVEFRNENWPQGRRSIMVTVGPGPGGEREVYDLLRYYQAHGGPADGFRYLDRTEYKTCFYRDTPTAFDAPLVLVPGETNVYQLTIEYSSGSIARQRKIFKPFIDASEGAIKVGQNGSTVLTVGIDYTIDYTTGLVTTAASGVLTWGGLFHLPVRFDGEFPVQIVNKRAQSVAFLLNEIGLEVDET